MTHLLSVVVGGWQIEGGMEEWRVLHLVLARTRAPDPRRAEEWKGKVSERERERERGRQVCVCHHR